MVKGWCADRSCFGCYSCFAFTCVVVCFALWCLALCACLGLVCLIVLLLNISLLGCWVLLAAVLLFMLCWG